MKKQCSDCPLPYADHGRRIGEIIKKALTKAGYVKVESKLITGRKEWSLIDLDLRVRVCIPAGMILIASNEPTPE